MKEREATPLTVLRQELRRHHFFGGGINISREDTPEFERALARAEYELGLLDPEVAVKVYSDYCKVAKKYGVDKPEYYAELAKAWLEDKDAVEGKAKMYYKCIVKR